MRFRLNLAIQRHKNEEYILPNNYQYALSSWIYRTICRSDKELIEKKKRLAPPYMFSQQQLGLPL